MSQTLDLNHAVSERSEFCVFSADCCYRLVCSIVLTTLECELGLKAFISNSKVLVEP